MNNFISGLLAAKNWTVKNSRWVYIVVAVIGLVVIFGLVYAFISPVKARFFSSRISSILASGRSNLSYAEGKRDAHKGEDKVIEAKIEAVDSKIESVKKDAETKAGEIDTMTIEEKAKEFEHLGYRSNNK